MICEECVVESESLAGVTNDLQFAFTCIPEIAVALTFFEVRCRSDYRPFKLLGARYLPTIGDGIVLDAAHLDLCALFDGDILSPPNDVNNTKYLCHWLLSLPLDLEFQRTGQDHQIADDVDLLSAFETVLVTGRTLEGALFDGGLDVLYPDQIAIAAAAARQEACMRRGVTTEEPTVSSSGVLLANAAASSSPVSLARG